MRKRGGSQITPSEKAGDHRKKAHDITSGGRQYSFEYKFTGDGVLLYLERLMNSMKIHFEELVIKQTSTHLLWLRNI